MGEGGAITIERIRWRGFPDHLRLRNGTVELVATLSVGPRILAYQHCGGPNVLAVLANQLGGGDEPEWKMRGGHRLWTAPEQRERTYAPDNAPVTATELGPGRVRLTPPPERRHGLQKELEVELAPRGSQVELTHRLINIGPEPTELSPWAVTALSAGGTAVVPLPPKAAHPGGPAQAASDADFCPQLALVLWPYTDLTDPRLTLGSRFVLVRHDAERGPLKLGIARPLGWLAYAVADGWFVKSFQASEPGRWPDLGAGVEVFTNAELLELETLGPLTRLLPGAAVEHVERWQLVPGIQPPVDEADAARLAASAGVLF
jgi:hypothetical protein